MNPGRTAVLAFVFFSFLYSLNSYYILIKDHFILERLALALRWPELQPLGINLSYRLHANSLSTLTLILILLGLSWSFYRLVRLRRSLQMSKVPLLFSLLALIYLFSYPSLSSDVFDYNNYNRVQYLHDTNPWLYPANTFPADGAIYFGNWIDRPSSYPTLSHALFGLNYFLFGAEIPWAILGFKLLNLGVFAGSLYLLSRTLTPSERPAIYYLLFNPLIWIEFIGNAHNDLYLGFFVLLACIFVAKKQPLLAGISLSASVFTKVSSLILLPLFGLQLLLTLSLPFTLTFVAAFLSVSLLLFLPLWPILAEYQANLYLQTNLQLRSLPFSVRQLFINQLGQASIGLAQKYQKLVTSPLLVAALLFLASRVKRLNLADLSIAALLAYLLVASPMLSPWYLGWFLPLLPLSRSPRLILAGLAFSLTSLFSYPMYFVSLYLKPFIDLWQLAMYLAMVVLPLVFLFAPKTWYHRLRHHFSPTL